MVRIEHYIYRSYIALARCERFEPITDEITEDYLVNGVRYPSVVTWEEDKPLTDKITDLRGVSAKEQFEIDIVPAPTYWQNRFICHRLVEIYGDDRVRKTEGFDLRGIFTLDKYKDIICPIKQGRWITRLAQYSIREIAAWRKAA